MATSAPDERAELDIDLSPVEYCLDYLTRAFPTRQMEIIYRRHRDGALAADDRRTRGNPVVNPQAEAARAELIEHICALPPIKAALDAILERFGHDKVAEITGTQ